MGLGGAGLFAWMKDDPGLAERTTSADLPEGYIKDMEVNGLERLVGIQKNGVQNEHLSKDGTFKMGADQLYERQPDGTFKYTGYTGKKPGVSLRSGTPAAGEAMANDTSSINRGAANIPGYSEWAQRLNAGAEGAANRAAPRMTAAYINPTAQAEFRGQQSTLADLLMQQAQGQSPSVAQAQLQQGTDRNLAQALAMAQSGRGAGAAGAMRQVANQRAAIGQQMAGDAGMLRLQEQQQAQGMLGNVLSGARGQDIGMATSQAQLLQDSSKSNLGAVLQQRQMNDQAVQYYVSQGLSLAQAQQQANMDMERLIANNRIGQADLALRADGQRFDQGVKVLGTVAKGAGDVLSKYGSK